MNRLLHLIRYDWALHAVLLLTNGLPDNVIFLRLRGGLARWFFGQCGRDLRLGRNLSFYNPSQINLGSRVHIAYGTCFIADAPIQVGDEVSFGPYCVVVSSNHVRRDGSFRDAEPARAPISIGRGAWLGAHVTITAGSTIGSGTAIGANAVVTGALPDNVLAAGLPARVVKRYE